MVQCSLSSDRVFAALGDATRRQIVAMLSQGDRTVSALAEALPISMQGTLKHLRVLEESGLVTRSKAGRTVTLRLRPEGINEAEAWLHRTRTFWAAQLTNLADNFEENP